MLFSVQELELRKIPFEVSVPPGAIDYLEGVRQSGALEARGVAELIGGALGDVRIKGHLKVALETECDRCLEPANFPIEADMDLFYRQSSGPEDRADEVEIHTGDTEIAFFEGDSLELNDVLREQVLLGLPMQRICRDNCRGICPECGQNRNMVDCGCQGKRADDRWSALKNVEINARK